MPRHENDETNDDLRFFRMNAAAIRARGHVLPHLDQDVAIHNYIRIADDISVRAHAGNAAAPGARRILDWGCGYGQMSFLLKRRGLVVTSFDIGPDDTALPDIPLCKNLDVVRTTRPTSLPFADASFNAVLSCGVLEHVDECSGVAGNELLSLREITRVLAPGGQFFIYQLPQALAWQEAVVRKLQLGYAHPRRYTAREIRRILAGAGFEVVSLRRANFIPKNLTGMPQSLRRVYSKFSRPLALLDRVMCRIPGLNVFAGVLEISARKTTA